MTRLAVRILRAARAVGELQALAPASRAAGAAALLDYAVLRLRLRLARVRGFCPLPHGFALFWLARFERSPGPVVEIGSAWGLSTMILARASRRTVVTVDTHLGSGSMKPESSLAEFTANTRRLGVGDRLEAHTMTSADLAAVYSGEPAALLYVDGLHTFEGATSDIDAWLPHVRHDALVVFDDYADPEFDVRDAVDAAASAGRLRDLRTFYGLGIARRSG